MSEKETPLNINKFEFKMSSDHRRVLDVPIGGRILNSQQMDSTAFPGRSARPGDPQYDQNFGQTAFSRAGTFHENQDYYSGSKPRYAGPMSSALAGGTGLPKDTRGENFV